MRSVLLINIKKFQDKTGVFDNLTDLSSAFPVQIGKLVYHCKSFIVV